MPDDCAGLGSHSGSTALAFTNATNTGHFAHAATLRRKFASCSAGTPSSRPIFDAFSGLLSTFAATHRSMPRRMARRTSICC